MARQIRRRDLWSSLFGALRERVAPDEPEEPKRRGAGRRSRPAQRPDLPPIPLRPPGALSELDFLQACRRCGACREACPPGILLKLGEAYGKAEGTPGFFPETGPCELCEDLPCAAACPSGALQAPGHWSDACMGLAEVIPGDCLDVQGTPCDECALACPTELMAIRMTAEGPTVSETRCTGCGLCTAACPAEPKAILVRPPSH